MTHEQNSESAEFRTRDRQIEIMTTNYMRAGLPIKAARKLATDEVTEAEARGAAEQRKRAAIEDEAENARFADADEENTLNALMRRHGINREEASEELNWWQERDKRFPLNKAEQRRKDAEGAEPVAWCLMTADGQIINGIHEEKHQAETYRHRKASDTLTPLYTRPANVAALEARVKELEGVCKEMRAALEPFAECADYFDADGNEYERDHDDDFTLGGKEEGDEEDVLHCLNVGHLRTARSICAAAIREGGER